MAKKEEYEYEAEDLDLETDTEDEDQLDETMAADSLSPNSRPVSGDSMSKIEMMKGVIGSMGAMEKSDLVDFFNQVQSQFGPGKDYGVGDKSGHNQATLNMKPSDAGAAGANVHMPMPKLSVKEDVAALFEGQDLSEEFKDKVSTLFDAAISARIIAEQARLEEEYEVAINEQFASINEMLVEKIDTYLDYVVENWINDNEVAIESSLRNELMDDFIGGLKGLFAEHYIEMPEEKVQVVESLVDKVAALENKLDEMVTENVELKMVVSEGYKNQILDEISSDLAMTQKEKFASLAEGLEFDGDFEAYQQKLEIIKETYFVAESTHNYSSNFQDETFEGELTEQTTYVDPSVNKYVQAISRSVKR
jgi:hypothetical protein